MNATKDAPDAAPDIPGGWPPNAKPALVIVLGRSSAWALLLIAIGSLLLLATIALRLDTLCDVVAVHGRSE